MIFRIFLLAVAIALVFWAVRVLLTPRLSQDKQQSDRGSKSQSKEDVVACKVCGLHVPRSEALTVNDQHYCSAEHRDQDQA
ncbi:MAG: PP0621 family protein [Gammaproteobacteria bacterium]